jgi:Fur family ferric uptake transcriptional regulator
MPNAKERFVNYLKQKNLKWSRQREFIVYLFLSTPQHVTTEELYEQARGKLPQIGYSTVHRTLKLLSECGLATESQFGGRYTRFENVLKGQHHDHLICTKCGRIAEFECEKIEKMQESMARQKGFMVTHHKLELYGICRDCKKSPQH